MWQIWSMPSWIDEGLERERWMGGMDWCEREVGEG